MSQKLYLRGGILGLLLAGANPAWSATKVYVSAAGGSFSHDESELTVTTATTETAYLSSSDDSDAINLTWGVASEVAHFGFEYYYQTVDLSGFAAEYTKNSLFYSGYWTPNLLVPKLYGYLGAGVGISELRLDSDDPVIGNDFSDTEAQYKVSLGIEYRFTGAFNVFGRFEQHFTKTYSNWVSADQRLTFEDSDQGCILLGVAGRF